MAYKVQKPCKICGKLYTPCGDCERDSVAFHWRTVSCSFECGQKYLQKVMAARELSKLKELKPKKNSFKNENNKESEQIE